MPDMATQRTPCQQHAIRCAGAPLAAGISVDLLGAARIIKNDLGTLHMASRLLLQYWNKLFKRCQPLLCTHYAGCHNSTPRILNSSLLARQGLPNVSQEPLLPCSSSLSNQIAKCPQPPTPMQSDVEYMK